jgi:hypothetical protein
MSRGRPVGCKPSVSLAGCGRPAITGLYLSYHLNLAAGGLIVLVTTGIFLLCWCLAPRHGLVAKLRARRRPALLPAAAEFAGGVRPI